MLDERHEPVAGRVQVLAPSHAEFAACEREGLKASPTPRDWPTDASGRFCLTTAHGVQTVRIRIDAPHHESRDVPLHARAPSISPPRIAEAPERITVEEDVEHAVEVLSTDSPDDLAEVLDVELWLECEAAKRLLATQRVTAGDLALLRIGPDFGDLLGSCRFVAQATSPTRGDTSVPSVPRPVLLQTRASLTELDQTLDDETLTLSVGVRTRAGPARHLRGILEARSGGAFLASCPLLAGSCQLSLDRGTVSRPVAVALITSDDAVLPAAPLVLEIPPSQPRPWPRILEGLLLAGFAAWLVHAWLGTRRRRTPEPPAPGQAGVTQANTVDGPISGLVRDAHTGVPISRAHLELLMPGPLQATPVAVTASDHTGRFLLPAQTKPGTLLTLRASAPNYLPVEERLRGTRLTVQLTHRRREALTALVRWARHRNLPFLPRPPGPGQIANYAMNSGSSDEARWASQALHRVYGPEPPTESDVTVLSTPQLR